MNDRFKFRVWDYREGCFITDHHLITANNGISMEVIGVGQDGDCYNDMDIEIMQCTGLKDSEGNLIYEGDIVESKQLYPSIVIYNSELICFEIGAGCNLPSHLSIYPNDKFKIIGNIYESPGVDSNENNRGCINEQL
jgi:hypothetical protein